MIEDFDRLTDLVMEHIAGLNRSGRMVINYAACFRELRAYLLENQTPYSPETADRWLGEIEGRTKKMSFNFYRSAVKALGEMCLTGEVKTERHEFSFQTDRELNEDFLAVRKGFTEWLEGRSYATAKSESRACSGILLDIQNAGVNSVSEITYDTLIGEMSLKERNTRASRVLYFTVLKFLMAYLYELGLVPYGYSLLIDCMTMSRRYTVTSLTEKEKASLKEMTTEEKTLNLEEYKRLCDEICAEHESAEYSAGAVRMLHTGMARFYLFMDMNGLRYSPACGDAWLGSIEPYFSTGKFKDYRRSVSLIKERFNGTGFQLGSRFLFKETALSRLPSWCVEDVENYFEIRRNEGLSHSTLRTYRSSVCRFCDSVDKAGIRSFTDLTPEDIKRFNATDVHSTPEGKNSCNSRIRKFLEYLGDAGKLLNRYLYLSLPSVCAKHEHIVTVLTQDEQRRVSEALSEDNTEVSLRDKAIISLGLYMGLRRCDVVKLAIDDIDWDAATIRVLQDKTDREITLPMPTQVANALYRYIMYERPVSPERKIFLGSKAPYRPVSIDICGMALRRVLPGRDIHGSGFHVTRKTYATNLLRNDAGVQEVAEALGHSDLSSVDKYLSLDEEHMRECAFSLEEKGIAYKGEF